MPGETNLSALIGSMHPALGEATYVFVTLAQGASPPGGLHPVMVFREAEGVTLILARDEAESAGLAGTFPCRMITLNVHSSLAAVGFLAAVTAQLAAAGIPANPVSAFHHDHVFVPVEQAEHALQILKEVAAG